MVARQIELNCIPAAGLKDLKIAEVEVDKFHDDLVTPPSRSLPAQGPNPPREGRRPSSLPSGRCDIAASEIVFGYLWAWAGAYLSRREKGVCGLWLFPRAASSDMCLDLRGEIGA